MIIANKAAEGKPPELGKALEFLKGSRLRRKNDLLPLFKTCVSAEKPEKAYSSNRGAARIDCASYICVEIYKEMNGYSDDQIEEQMEARNETLMAITGGERWTRRATTRTRGRLAKHKEETGEDLIAEAVSEATVAFAAKLGVESLDARCQDSTFVETGARDLSRQELLYETCGKLVREAEKAKPGVPEALSHYLRDDDRNKTFYYGHNSSERLGHILADCEAALEAYADFQKVSFHFSLLERALDEQTVVEAGPDGKPRRRLKGKGEGMTGKILQSPRDWEATYRTKNGEGRTGYPADIVEGLGTLGGESVRLILYHSVRQNTCSDADFGAGWLKMVREGKAPVAPSVLITDAAYDSGEARRLAKSEGVELTRTNLTGKKPSALLAGFRLRKDGSGIESCPAGLEPTKTGGRKGDGKPAANFRRSDRENRPHFSDRKAKLQVRSARVVVSESEIGRAGQAAARGTREFAARSNARNGIEGSNSLLKNHRKPTDIPLVGFLRMEMRIHFKMASVSLAYVFGALSRLKVWKML